MPFGPLGAGKFGTYFIGYAADTFGHGADAAAHVSGIHPATTTGSSLLHRCHGSLFFVRTADFLDDPPASPDEGDGTMSVGNDAVSEDGADPGTSGDGPLGIGGLTGTRASN